MKAFAERFHSPRLMHVAFRCCMAIGMLWVVVAFGQPPREFELWLRGPVMQRILLDSVVHGGAADPAETSLESAPEISDLDADPDSIALSGNAALLSNFQWAAHPEDLVDAPRFNAAGMDAQSVSRASECLAAAVWYEAGDDAQGERAVAQVVLNRVRHPSYPSTVCDVVFQGADRTTGCQFTFACDGSLAARTPSVAAFARARAIAMAALMGQVDRNVGTATHYHADYVVPRWRSRLQKIATVGHHIFYRWEGRWGSPDLLGQGRPRGVEPFVSRMAALSPFHVDESQGGDTRIAGAALPEVSDPPQAPPAAVGQVRSRPIIAIQLSKAVSPGSFALRALEACKGRESCNVLGWTDPGAMSQALPLSGEAKAALDFVYVRRNGSEGIYWNCASYQRADPRQCMPANVTLDRLLGQS